MLAKFEGLEFGFKAHGLPKRKLMPFKMRTQSLKAPSQRFESIPTSPQTYTEISSLYKKTQEPVKLESNPTVLAATSVCVELFFRFEGKFKGLLMQDLCDGTRSRKGLSFTPWKYTTLKAAELGCADDAKCRQTCEGEKLGAWNNEKQQCFQLFGAAEVCAMTFPGEVDVAYFGGCFKDGETVRYAQIPAGKTYTFEETPVTLRHPADPYITSVRMTDDSSVYFPLRADGNRVGGISGWTLLVSGIAAMLLIAVGAFGLWAKHTRTHLLVETPVKTDEIPRASVATTATLEMAEQANLSSA